jgi:hypothetical protein
MISISKWLDKVGSPQTYMKELGLEVNCLKLQSSARYNPSTSSYEIQGLVLSKKMKGAKKVTRRTTRDATEPHLIVRMT